ncbi:hypothetical protein [Halomontanus rarus]|uniref:hypothetical protein n=1 Tax=Halomontanus rarus TaxID=3034020 RepID=UPI0023E88F14|nr:hypothetical protein [Halovivax sp. TS33]
MSKAVALVLVALVVTTAGCSAFESSDDREPYGVDEVVEIDSELLPGLTDDGVTDRVALRNAHIDALTNDAYRQRQRITQRGETGEIEYLVVQNRSVGDETALIVDELDPASLESDENTTVSYRVWADGTTSSAYARVVDRSGAVSYRPAPDYTSFDPSTPVSLLSLYDAVDTVIVERHDEGERYRLEGTGDLNAYGNTTFELLLTERGYVESYSITVTDGGRVTEYEGGFTPDPDLELEEPDWLEEAKAEIESEWE